MLFVPSGEPPEMFDAVEEALDAVARAIVRRVKDQDRLYVPAKRVDMAFY
jgi:hypothetical protein